MISNEDLVLIQIYIYIYIYIFDSYTEGGWGICGHIPLTSCIYPRHTRYTLNMKMLVLSTSDAGVYHENVYLSVRGYMHD